MPEWLDPAAMVQSMCEHVAATGLPVWSADRPKLWQVRFVSTDEVEWWTRPRRIRVLRGTRLGEMIATSVGRERLALMISGRTWDASTQNAVLDGPNLWTRLLGDGTW